MKLFNRFYFLIVLFIWSCGTSDVQPINDKIYLVEAEKAGKATKSEIIENYVAALGGNSLVNNFLKYDVDFYKLTYKTKNTDGKEIFASGAVVIPIKNNASTILSLQHGTILNETDAPSYFKANSEGAMGIVLGSLGFIAVMPDYIGYGVSKNYPHPYEHAKGLAVANVDFLLAVKEFLKDNNTEINNQLLLAGYSEGGYATLATQKRLEEEFSKEFTILASSVGAGAYHKSALMSKFINEDTVGEINHNRSYIWVMNTYNRIYGFNRPMSYYFREDVAKQIEQNGINVNFTGSFRSLLNPNFIKSFNEGNETELVNAFKENDLVNWKSNVKTTFYHGDQDDYVPYFNSVNAYEGMTKAGSSNLKLETIVGKKHDSAIETYILQTLLQFLGYSN